ncbi:DUF4124 domain-containing protein [Rhodanobacter sp. L36]|uniref:DUF4124 domain-containing protein n=1 Tax=Rhodanobacter sp. L36 TaxID=1747221 RepID=UPI001576C668|nr:DUF4124 domain-containing protein [Rhodanobacter sp. L36]
MHRSLIALALLSLATLATAQVYKWTDAHGTIHYSEAPPTEGTNFKKVRANGSAEPLAPPAAPAAANSAPTAASSGLPVMDTPENRGKLCTMLKANLTVLQAHGPVVQQQGDKSVALDDAQRKQQVDSTQGQIQQYCQSK